jgi:uncharacterized protein (UPF0248 family)
VATKSIVDKILDKPEEQRDDAERAVLEKHEVNLEYDRTRKVKERVATKSIVDKILDKPEEQRDDCELVVSFQATKGKKERASG